jgi:Domain of unknown function (DUF4349)
MSRSISRHISRGISGGRPTGSARRVLGALAIGASLLIGAAACGAGSDNSASSGASRGEAPNSAQSPGAASERKSVAGASGAAGDAAKVAPAVLTPSSQYLARRAQLSLKVKNIAQAAAAVRAASTAAGGLILAENIGGSSGPVPVEGNRVTANTYGEITISVPADRLDAFLDDVSRLGTVISRQSSSEDVKQQYVDTDARLKTMRASVDRVRALMARATDIGQIVALESELARREADLEALESQMAALKDSIARSPVQVSLTTDPSVVEKDETGFLAGLKRGWSAFTASASALVTVIGALLPFALLAALVAYPLTLWLRRRRASRTLPSAPTATPAPAAGTGGSPTA